MSTPPQHLPSFSGNRRLSIGLHVLVSVGAVLALVVMANYLAARHFTRGVWRAENPYQLTPMTTELLHSLTNRVKVIVFWNKEEDRLGLLSSVSGLLNEYELASPWLSVRYVDQLRNPSAALLIRDHYKLALPGEDFAQNLVIFDCNGRAKAVYEKELYDLDMTPLLTGKSREIKRSNFKGELQFTSAIINVTEARRPKVCFLEGHKEHPLQEDDPLAGYSKFHALLRQLNIQIEPIFLRDGELPDDCQLLIIAGPQQALEPAELERIDRYAKRGGRLLVLFHYQVLFPTRLESSLTNWGVSVGYDWVMDAKSFAKKTDSSFREPLVITNYPSPAHPIVRPLLRSRLAMAFPRTVERLAAGKQDADSAKVDELAASGPNVYAVTDFPGDVPRPDYVRNRRGPMALAVAVEKGGVQGVAAERGVTRMVIIGDSMMFCNQMLDVLANRDFAVQAVEWLLDRSKLMGGIGPRAVREFQIVMTASQMAAVRWILLGAFPGSVLALGLGIWFRRRK